MAKYNWRKIRDDYEIHGLSYSQINAKYGVSKSTISDRAKKDGWDRQKTEQTINDLVNAERNLREITERNRTENGFRAQIIEREAERRLRLEGIFLDAIEENQVIANNALKNMDRDTLSIVDIHSRVTSRNKESVVGKVPTTQVNIQQNNESSMTVIAVPEQETEDTWNKK